MPSDPSNPCPPVPDEADLLALIEGERLPRDREAALMRALDSNPRLARRIDAMRRDRAALRSLPEVSCPPGVMAAVEAALQPVLERQMLLGLRDGQPVDEHLPVSVVQPARRSVFAAFFAERGGRRMALAAGLLLLVGGASYLAATFMWPSPSPSPVHELAMNDGGEVEVAGVEAADTGESRTLAAKSAEPSIAAFSAPTEEPPDAAAATAPVEIAAAPAESPADTLVAGVSVETEAPSANTSIDAERAIALAREGRLVIRLKAPDPVVLADPERIAARIRSRQSPAWRLGEQAPAQLASLLNAATPAPYRPPQPAAPQPITFAGGYVSDLPEGFYGPPRPPVEGFRPVRSAVYLVQTRLDAAALDSLRDALAPYGEPVFEEAAEPLPIDNSAALTPNAVVWWSQPPAGWTWWASVPVVIDQAP